MTKISFVTDNDTDFYDFVFSDDLFLSLFVTFSDESFRHKKLKLLAMK